MTKATKANIRAAITANRGGLTKATDDQLGEIWSKLSADTQKQYLESVKSASGEKKPNK